MNLAFWRSSSKKEIPKHHRFLIIRLSSIGDIVLTTPLVRCLRRQFPDATIDFLLKPAFASVLQANPYIDNILLYTPEEGNFLPQLKAQNYTHIIDLHHNLRTLRLKQALDIHSTSFPKLNIEKWLVVNFKWKRLLPDTSIVERYFETVAPIGVKNDGEGLDYHIPKEMETNQDDIPMSHWAGYVACVLGGSKATKQLPVSQWIAFAKLCPFPIIMLGGPGDQEAAEKVAAAIPQDRVYNACGKFKLHESADLVKKARVVVSNDTGLMHIAAAFQKPIVSLWGNTIPEFGMYPYYGANNLHTRVASKLKIVEDNTLSCRPCSKIGFEACPKKHFKCMHTLSMDEVAKQVAFFWKQLK